MVDLTVLAAVLFSFGLVSRRLEGTVLAPTDAALGQAVVSNPRVPVRVRQALNVGPGSTTASLYPFWRCCTGSLLPRSRLCTPAVFGGWYRARQRSKERSRRRPTWALCHPVFREVGETQ